MTQNKNKGQAAWDILFSCKSADEVADLMRKCNIKGEPREPARCPISNYLTSTMGDRYSATTQLIINRENNDLHESTKAMKSFIERFDLELYSVIDLIEE